MVESVRPARRLIREQPWPGRAWTLAVVALPIGLFLHGGLVDDYLVPMLIEAEVPDLAAVPDRQGNPGLHLLT